MALSQREQTRISRQLTILATAAHIAEVYEEPDLAKQIDGLATTLDNKRKVPN